MGEAGKARFPQTAAGLSRGIGSGSIGSSPFRSPDGGYEEEGRGLTKAKGLNRDTYDAGQNAQGFQCFLCNTENRTGTD